MAEEKLQRLEVVTPERKVFSGEAGFVVVPGSEGELGFLRDHAPLMSALKTGIIRVYPGGLEDKPTKIAVSGGFVEARDSLVTILANAAELGDQIDLTRAEAAKQRAEQRLASGSADIDVARAEAALMRAINRIKAAS